MIGVMEPRESGRNRVSIKALREVQKAPVKTGMK
jgi:hypothetical protein